MQFEENLTVYVADAGSVARGNFHWVSSKDPSISSSDPGALAAAVADDLRNGKRVALGYECPLFVPIEADAGLLGRARDGECQPETGNRPFTAGAGASVFATGVQSLAWVLREVNRTANGVSASTRWRDFRTGTCSLFVWEAFVSGSEKAYPPSHAEDAALAISAFLRVCKSDANPTRLHQTTAFSLAGAALINAKLSADLSLLSEPCVVIRPLFSAEEATARLVAYKLRKAEAAKAKVDK